MGFNISCIPIKPVQKHLQRLSLQMSYHMSHRYPYCSHWNQYSKTMVLFVFKAIIMLVNLHKCQRFVRNVYFFIVKQVTIRLCIFVDYFNITSLSVRPSFFPLGQCTNLLITHKHLMLSLEGSENDQANLLFNSNWSVSYAFINNCLMQYKCYCKILLSYAPISFKISSSFL